MAKCSQVHVDGVGAAQPGRRGLLGKAGRELEKQTGAGNSPREGRGPGFPPPPHPSLPWDSEVPWLLGRVLECMLPSPGHIEELDLG